MNIKPLIKDFIPPFLARKLTATLYGWRGNYSSWTEAKKKCSGYDSETIFNKVRSALLKVKNGEATYERDSVLFDTIHYSFPLVSALALVALNNGSKLNVLDFGGSLGSSYYQNRNLFSELELLNWNVVEQPHFVKEGQSTFADEQLHFFYDIDTCMSENRVDVLLLSSVLQYLENPYDFLEMVFAKRFEYIVIDRMPLLLQGSEKITIQKVAGEIYKAEYPCWLLNEKIFLDKMLEHYDLIFDCQTEETIHIKHGAFKAFFLKRKKTG
ncbi:MAG: methyltransferase, TIGR04325 family [Bacteroidetes bacterium]|nr:methyltransferase, TIGR04325 family [Bacteroidota bacterium]